MATLTDRDGKGILYIGGEFYNTLALQPTQVIWKWNGSSQPDIEDDEPCADNNFKGGWYADDEPDRIRCEWCGKSHSAGTTKCWDGISGCQHSL